ncbi:MAG: NADH-quinone oxidoreductase subunit NuoE [bacterium]|nr:MAG: NADH-quinone oxidoreductase subunit NuoE [bacterium]
MDVKKTISRGMKMELEGVYPDRSSDEALERKVESILSLYGHDSSQVIAILQDVQAEFGYLPQTAFHFLAERLGIPLVRLYGIATFFKAFRLTPRGRHEIKLCTGTACHVRGAELVKDAITRELGIEVGQTTDDLAFSLEKVRCIGCCGIAPAMMVNKDVHGKVSAVTLNKVLSKYK